MVSIEMAFDWTDHINILRLGSSLKGLKTYSNTKERNILRRFLKMITLIKENQAL